ncbi:MAG TPA: SpoIID/LytB domain-containing protein, partial [Actinomycetota bacterium]
MRNRPLARASWAAVVVVALSGACTSAPTEPVDDRPSAAATPTAGSVVTSPTPTPEPTVAPDAGSFRVTGQRVLVRPPRGGSFRVRGLYPWRASRCVDAERPMLDGRYPGVLSIRAVDDGTLTVAVTLDFQSYLEGIAEVPPTWPAAALEAQVIAARSYVLARTGWSGEQGEDLGTPICGTADCQVYGGIPQPRPPGLHRWFRAVRETRGRVLW